jgi:hypothetical protein
MLAQLERSVREGLTEPNVDQLLDEMSGQGLVDVEAKRSGRGRITRQLRAELREDGAAVWQVAEMVLECGEPGDRLAPNFEGWGAVGHPLVGAREDVHDRLTQAGERAALWLVQGLQVGVDLCSRHGSIVPLVAK